MMKKFYLYMLRISFTGILLFLGKTVLLAQISVVPDPSLPGDGSAASPYVLPSGIYGSPYNPEGVADFYEDGANYPSEFGFSGLLISGISMDPFSGILSGTPEASGTIKFTVSVASDGTGTSAPVWFQLTIGKAPLTITINDVSMVYGAAIPSITGSIDGWVNNDGPGNVTLPGPIIGSNTANLPVGTYPFLYGSESTANYYLVSGGGTLTVTPATLTIVASNLTKVYGEAMPGGFAGTWKGFVNGDSPNNLTPLSMSIPASPTSPVGSYPVTLSGAIDSNYIDSFPTLTLIVTPATLHIKANDTSMVYGGAIPAFTVSLDGAVNAADSMAIMQQISFDTISSISSSPQTGSYQIRPVIKIMDALDSNYRIYIQSGYLTVNPALLKIRPDSATSIYGAPLVPSGSLTVTYSGFVNSDNASIVNRPPMVNYSSPTPRAVGTYNLIPLGASAPNYTMEYDTGVYTITPAPLTIIPVSDSMTYGGKVPALTAQYQGFVNHDDSSSLTKAPTLSTTAMSSSPAGGTYWIRAVGAVDPNYAITYDTGTMVIKKATLTLVTSNITKVYGAGMPGVGGYWEGLVNGDSPGPLSDNYSVTSTSPVGSYLISFVGDTTNSNYNVSLPPDTLIVTPAPLKIYYTSPNTSKVYGAAMPPFHIIGDGFVNGQGFPSLTTQPSIFQKPSSTSPVGSYVLAIDGAIDSNYIITYGPPITLTVTPAPLTIQANDTSMVYGGAVPAFTVSLKGIVDSADSATITQQLSFNTTASSSFQVGGSYNITPALENENAVDANYNIQYVSGNLIVNPALLKIRPDSATSIYGSPLKPTDSLTFTYSGFVNGDNAGSLTSLPIVTNSAPARAGVGTYWLTPSGAVDLNYTMQYDTGVYTITPASLQIYTNDTSKVYGAPMPSLSLSYRGFVYSEDSSSLTMAPTISTTATATSSVGSYPMTIGGAADSNYSITYGLPDTFTVTPASLTIKANDDSMVYGGTVPAFTVSFAGIVDSVDSATITQQLSFNTIIPSPLQVGSFVIVPYDASDSNYTITYGPGNLTVNPAMLKIRPDSATSVYGSPLKPTDSLTFTYSGFVNGDNAGSLKSLPIVTNSAPARAGVGTYWLTPSGAVDLNYTMQYDTGVYTITPASLQIDANDTSKVYGAPMPSLSLSYRGFVYSEDSSSLTTAPTISTTATATSPVGSYAISVDGAADSNYIITYGPPDTIFVTPASLTIKANDDSMVYGGTVPAFTVSLVGIVDSADSAAVTQHLSFNTTIPSPLQVGTYPINPVITINPVLRVEDALASNYIMSYQSGNLIVTPAVLKIRPDSASSTYGSPLKPDSALTVTYSGFVGNDSAGSLTTQPVVTNPATTGAGAGTYWLTASGAVATNYTMQYDTGIYRITPATLQIAADDTSKVYGTSDPAWNYAVSGFVNGDSSSTITGSLSRVPGENVGIYPIGQGTLSAGKNYVMNFTGSDLTITKAPQEITWNQSLLFGCDSARQLQLTATVSSGLPITYTSAHPDVATVAGDALTLVQPGTAVITATQPGDGNHYAAPDLTDTAVYQALSLVRQHWNDVLFFDNSSDNYVQWQWYKNNDPIPGAVGQDYNSAPSVLNGQYYVIATDKTGNTIQSCPLTITAGGAIPEGIKVYPNPTSPGSSVTIHCNYPAASLQGAQMLIADLLGTIRQQITNVQPSMQVTMPAGGGMYIIKLQLANGQVATVNVLVTK